jgi:hypothetical protein
MFFATLLLSLAAVASAQDGVCTSAMGSGAWSYTLTGTLIMPAPAGAVPFGVVGRTAIDIDGNGTATQTSSTGGQIAQETAKDTVTVNPDCTASLSVSIYDQSGTLLRKAQFAGVLVNNGNELRAIMTSIQVATANGMVPVPAVVTIEVRKLFPVQEIRLVL